MASNTRHVNTMNAVATSNRGNLIVRVCSCGDESEHPNLGVALLAKQQHESAMSKTRSSKNKKPDSQSGKDDD